MTETGSTVERLRIELDRVESAPYVTVLRVERDDLRAMLAVVEAAQELRSLRPGQSSYDARVALDDALAALHSQASDDLSQNASPKPLHSDND